MSQELLQFDSLVADISTLVAPTRALMVTDFRSGAEAIEAVKQVKDLANKVEKKRKELVGPLNDQVKAINEYARSISAPLAEAETHVKAQLRDFELEQERIRAEVHRKAEEERIRKEAELRAQQEAERIALEAQLENEMHAAKVFGSKTEVSEAEVVDFQARHEAMEEKQLQEQAIQRSEAEARRFDINQRGIKNTAKVWKCEIVDIDQVPKEYLIRELNTQAVLAMARAGHTNIPGVRLWQDVTVRIGSKTYVPKAALVGEER